jgi:RimJ/RimL family protein N-acetyltransferase
MGEELAHSLRSGVIGTRRLVLRPLRAGDAAALFALFNDWEVVRFLSAPPWPYAREDADSFIAMVSDPASKEVAFAITLAGKLIGCATVRDSAASALQSGAGPNIGYWIGRPYWGKGYMTEALRALVTHVFALSRAEAIYCGAFADNLASLRVQRNVGFIHAGDATCMSRPTGHELAHVNTVLTRAAFVTLAA